MTTKPLSRDDFVDAVLRFMTRNNLVRDDVLLYNHDSAQRQILSGAEARVKELEDTLRHIAAEYLPAYSAGWDEAEQVLAHAAFIGRTYSAIFVQAELTQAQILNMYRREREAMTHHAVLLTPVPMTLDNIWVSL